MNWIRYYLFKAVIGIVGGATAIVGYLSDKPDVMTITANQVPFMVWIMAVIGCGTAILNVTKPPRDPEESKPNDSPQA